MSFFAELKRRNVVRAGIAYMLFGWLLLRIASTLVPAFRLPDWTQTAVGFLLILGLPLVLAFTWIFEITPEGLKRESEVARDEADVRRTGRRLDYAIIAALLLVVVYFSVDKFLLDPRRDAEFVERASQTAGPVTATVGQPSIAVLPFVNLSGDPEQEYFSDGLAEELLHALAGIPELRVAARTSSFSFKDEKIDIPTVADKLNVAHVLEGSVRQSGEILRITAQLVEADSGYHLWSQTFDRELEDVFTIQDEIAAAVVAALEVELLGEVPKARAIDPDAYALYLQGRHFNARQTQEGDEKAVEAYRAALNLEPDYAPAWSALALTYTFQANRNDRDLHEGFALARAAVERALAIDERLAEGHTNLGWIHLYYDWDWQKADAAMQRGLALAPGDAPVLTGAGVAAAALGRLDDSVELFRRAIERDPLRLSGHHNLGLVLTAAGRLDEASGLFRRVLDLDPEFSGAHAGLGVVLLLQDEPERALDEMKQESDAFLRDHGTLLALLALGRDGEAEERLAAFIDQYDKWAALQVAEIYAWRGELDSAFTWLDTAYRQRDGGLAEILGNPLLASLRTDSRWPALLDKLGLPH